MMLFRALKMPSDFAQLEIDAASNITPVFTPSMRFNIFYKIISNYFSTLKDHVDIKIIQ
jgi:hypothetical protein